MKAHIYTELFVFIEFLLVAVQDRDGDTYEDTDP